MTELKMPNFTLNPQTGMGTLRDGFMFPTSVIGRHVMIEKIVLTEDGSLSIGPDYKWDFGSGPAIDTPGMVAASLAHDALYDLIREGFLPNSDRKKADKTFRKLLKAYGVGMFRRTYCYWAVRWFGGIHVDG